MNIGHRAMLAAIFSAAAFASDVTQAPRDPDKTEFVRRMVSAGKLDLDIRVVVDPNPHCAYATTEGGQHYIAVDPSCVGAAVENGRYVAHNVAVLSHEIGHIELGHTVSGDNTDATAKRQQLEADEAGGRLVAQLGGGLAQAQAFVATLPETSTSPREPGRAARISAVAKGWREGRIQMASIQPQSWEPENQGPFHVCWQSFWMGSAATFLVVVFFMRR